MTTSAEFVLGVDGGGSKTLARLIRLSDGQRWESSAGPSSLTNDLQQACEVVNLLVSYLLQQAGASASQVSVMMGLAGGGSARRVTVLRNQLDFDFAALCISTDASTSLYGANLGEPVCIIALGTGSVAARLDADGSETIQGGWGFNAGDEGSGAKLGLAAAKVLLEELDHYAKPVSPLGLALASVLGHEREQALEWVAEAGPRDYAALVQLVERHGHECAIANGLMRRHCDQVTTMLDNIRGESHTPVALLGGLAALTRQWLPASLNAYLTEAKGSALDGACLLAARQVRASERQLGL